MKIQTKRTIDALKKAGFKRNEFKVRTDRRYIDRHPDTGKQMFEYGKTRILLLATKEKTMRLTDCIRKQGISVMYTLCENDKGEKFIGFPRLNDDGKGQLLLWDTLKNDKNPYGIIYPIKDLPKIK